MDRQKDILLLRNFIGENYTSWIRSYHFIREKPRRWIEKKLRNLKSDYLIDTVEPALKAVRIKFCWIELKRF